MNDKEMQFEIEVLNATVKELKGDLYDLNRMFTCGIAKHAFSVIEEYQGKYEKEIVFTCLKCACRYKKRIDEYFNEHERQLICNFCPDEVERKKQFGF